MPIANDAYVQHQEIIIQFDEARVRFWLPKDRPLRYILEALLKADDDGAKPFDNLKDTESYDFKSKDEQQVLDPNMDLMRLQLNRGDELVLVRRSLPKAYFRISGAAEQPPIRPGMTIGYARGRIGTDIGNYLDLSAYASGDWTTKISRKHARIFDREGQYWMEVLHGNGVYAKDRVYDVGEKFMLVNGLRLIIVQLNIDVIIE